MPLVAAKCTSCGGILEIDDEKDAAICEYCGTPFVVEKAINNFVINNNIQAENVFVQAVEKEFDISGGILKRYLGNDVNVVIPDGIFEIQENCFRNTYIQKVEFPKELKKIGKSAFEACENLDKIVYAGCCISEIGEKAFFQCKKLRSFDLGYIESIGEKAFAETSLEGIEISKEIKNIGKGAFENCKKLKKAKMSDELEYNHFDDRMAFFEGCDLLLNIDWKYCNSILDVYREYNAVYLND